MEIIEVKSGHSLVTSAVDNRPIEANSYKVNCRQYASIFQPWQKSHRSPTQPCGIMTLDYVRIWITEQEGSKIAEAIQASHACCFGLTRTAKHKWTFSMDEQQLIQSHAHVRGAATFILLRRPDAPMNAAKLMELYPVDLQTVTAEFDAIVLSEQHKVGGMFELVPAPTAN